ncbi:MAG TPA: methyltransferase type 11 [Alphaproteobacteria bacterium]|nr:methyltransferase type 11 [Alphaproteobacteria bacterium]HCO89380.1 methyltransferase type 11 [Alphaproteobacteria bacterium]
MHLDVIDMHAFYSSRLGQTAAAALQREVRAIWPNLSGYSVLGLGYATPFLTPFLGEAIRVVGAMPARQGVIYWPAGGAALTMLVDEVELPLPDAAFDRVLVAHYLETSEHIRPALREIWRILAPGGKLLLIAPNRNSLWARRESTPFGHGRPFSRLQLTSLLRDAMFTPECWRGALHMPPLLLPLFSGRGGGREIFGSSFLPRLAGVHLVEARKQIYAPIPAVEAAGRRRQRSPVLRPVPTGPATARFCRAAGTGPAPQISSRRPEND